MHKISVSDNEDGTSKNGNTTFILTILAIDIFGDISISVVQIYYTFNYY